MPIKHPAPEKVFVAVHRTDFLVYYKRLAEDVYLLLSGIQDGLSLPDALDFAFADSGIAK